MDDIRLNHQVFKQELGRETIVNLNAADLGRRYPDSTFYVLSRSTLYVNCVARGTALLKGSRGFFDESKHRR